MNAAPLTPAQKQAIRDANIAKRAAKRAKHTRGLRPSSDSLRPIATATGSIVLTDASALKYFIDTNITFSTSSSASGAASEASYAAPVMASTTAGGVVSSTLSDMFDGYNSICVSLTGATGPCQTGNAAYVMYLQNGPSAFDATVPAVPECTNRQVVQPAKVIGPLSVQRKIYVPTNDQFIRWANFFTNTSGAPVTFTMITGNNLGSDANTRLVSSSSGDAAAQTTDTWVSTFQNYSGSTSSDPRIGHVLQGVGAPTPVSNVVFTDGNDNPYWAYSITLAPGQTKMILNYATGQPSKAAANAKAAALALLPTTATQCLSNAELAQVANFAVSTDLAIVKTASVVTNVNASQTYQYTLSVTNNGPATASSLTVTDPLPAGLTFNSASGTGWTCSQLAGTVTCTLPTLAVGAANPITISVTAPATAVVLSNTATVSSTTTEINPANNSSTNNLAVIPISDLSIVKTASAPPVNAGAAFSYTLNVSNAGPSPATAVSVADTLPAGTTFVSATGTGWSCSQVAGTVTCTMATLAVGAANPITINLTAPASAGPLSNTATVSSTTTDPTPANNSSTVGITVVAVADLSITKAASSPTVAAGGAFTYTLNVTNAGPSVATSVSVSDTLPTGTGFVSATGTGWSCSQAAGTVTCTMASLAVGAANPITINVTAPVTAGPTSNVATVTTTTTDPTPANNTSAPAPVTVTASADLSITKTTTATAAYGNQPLSYTLAVSNAGPSSAPNVTVSDVLPAGSSFVSATGTGWTCNAAAGVVTCTLPTLAVGAAAPITLTIIPPSMRGTLSNTATVSSTAADASPAGNSSTAALALFPASAIPALDPSQLALLAALLGVVAVFVIRRNG